MRNLLEWIKNWFRGWRTETQIAEGGTKQREEGNL